MPENQRIYNQTCHLQQNDSSVYILCFFGGISSISSQRPRNYLRISFPALHVQSTTKFFELLYLNTSRTPPYQLCHSSSGPHISSKQLTTASLRSVFLLPMFLLPHQIVIESWTPVCHSVMEFIFGNHCYYFKVL